MRRRGGFTLIELMVAVTLTIIILGMFALMYRWTTQTYTNLKGIRRNDQRSRMMITILQNDLQLRTFKDVVPFVPGQRTDTAVNYNGTRREGYFAISENDPDNGTDDVLALTVRIPGDNPQLPFQGRAKQLCAASITLTGNRNQPEFDDGNPTPNDNGASRIAEVAYFLRHATLYRRVLLVREPYDDEGSGTAQPPAITADYTQNSGVFWRDFDYSAFHKTNGTNTGLKFHDARIALKNENPPSSTVDPDLNFPLVLGITPFRFGYSFNRGATVRLLPREYVGSGAGRRFIGRFLLREAADDNFGYPGRIPAGGDPHARALTYNSSTGLVSEFAGNRSRRGEDILMTNVHEFDVKVWDDALGRFVDLGHQQQNAAGGNGNYHRARNLRDPNFASGNFDWNRFDTWHPFRDPNTGNSMGNPPYKAGGTGAALGSPAEKPLRAIQITIRFFDVPTKKMRQVTIVQRLN